MSALENSKPTRPLRSISDIRRFFHRNETPIYFVSATNFNLLGADEWVKGFKFICYMDCFDRQYPNIVVPNEMSADERGRGERRSEAEYQEP